jgi:hypothetical protein
MYNGSVCARAVTGASLARALAAWNTLGSFQRSPDISPLVQEVVDRSGWQSGNSLAFIIDSSSGASGGRWAESFDGAPTAPPLLHVAYAAEPGPPGGNVAPTANAGPDQSVADSDGLAGEVVDLDGSASADSDGSIVSYAWTWSGGSAAGVAAAVSLADGITLVTLTVTDDGGDSASDTVAITVAAPSDPRLPATWCWMSPPPAREKPGF